MSGAVFDPTSRLRSKVTAVSSLVLAVVLLVFTGCANSADRVLPNGPLARARQSVGSHELKNAECTEAAQRATSSGAGQSVHVVRAGETLSELALRYRVRTSAICQLNCIHDPDRIEVGQRLRLPREAIPAPRARPAGIRPPAPAPVPTRADALLSDAEKHYMAARFERALESAQAAEALLEGESDRRSRARAAFIAGSALVGLGEDQRASEQFARVHALDSRFEPPAGWLSPRLGAFYRSASSN